MFIFKHIIVLLFHVPSFSQQHVTLHFVVVMPLLPSFILPVPDFMLHVG